MKPTLYFLRSSEQKILTDMLHYAMRLDEVNKSLSDLPKLSIYSEFYGYTSKDLGLYALVDNQLAGAIWIRRLNADHGSNGYIDDNTPILNIAVLPEFRDQGIGSQMIEQLFIEAGALYENISVSVVEDSLAVRFYERHGFIRHDNGFVEQSFVDGKKVIALLKKLQKAAVIRPSDGYDPRRWMD
ncbi:MAG: GNAT family N-acetyltransferase [Sulfuricurvum sp.]|uniref:GNAT family N-acetyltransferase n=1 Tax=Sulfuricurvum sp. TaxID=2025608 RepID=UPI0025F45B56|nr:GNAT family N-acetyltransferase [Sulfuricurvum sp.]MBV5321400.1 GNAT family N-acetyltransferase [Sulfuricurvum sp.]